MAMSHAQYLLVSVIMALSIFYVKLEATPSGQEVTVEVCQLEKLVATCAKNHVILVKSARFGRMKVGRCLSRDYYVGCNVDVIAQLDANCSGKAHCEIPVPSESLVRYQICPNDLVSYLEVTYECVPVADTCRSSDRSFVGGAQGFLTSFPYVTCTYVIQVQRGQHIELTLYDMFTPSKTNVVAQGEGQGRPIDVMCDVYAEVYEDDVTGSESGRKICAKEKRQTVVYISVSPTIRVTVHGSAVSDDKKFLLNYAAIGCPDPTPPADAYVLRHGDRADVICNRSAITWHLACNATSMTWSGLLGNCTSGASLVSTINTAHTRGFGISMSVILAVMVGVVLGVTLGVSLLCLVIHVRRRLLHKRRQAIGGRDQGDSFIGRRLPPPGTASKLTTYYEPCTLRTRTVSDDYGQRPGMTTLPIGGLQLSAIRQANNDDSALPMTTGTLGRTFVCHGDGSDVFCQYCGDVTNPYPTSVVPPPDVTSTRSPRRVLIKGDVTPLMLKRVIDDL